LTYWILQIVVNAAATNANGATGAVSAWSNRLIARMLYATSSAVTKRLPMLRDTDIGLPLACHANGYWMDCQILRYTTTASCMRLANATKRTNDALRTLLPSVSVHSDPVNPDLHRIPATGIASTIAYHPVEHIGLRNRSCAGTSGESVLRRPRD
jgi:hypothetical protein